MSHPERAAQTLVSTATSADLVPPGRSLANAEVDNYNKRLLRRSNEGQEDEEIGEGEDNDDDDANEDEDDGEGSGNDDANEDGEEEERANLAVTGRKMAIKMLRWANRQRNKLIINLLHRKDGKNFV
ncbi:hypothetical protein PHYBOEH_010604 [Phytophthora boehmeriae]|uniref:RxLR effector protein n=1 Tax=Phytophthora boehmeriae TaxID=109152 RepID=A0A8T1VML3_9STRA|nr:hypothetical protein PHYBOEH_010604 [Phytophthora boehmeriae]